MAAQRRRSARRDRAHHALLGSPHMPDVVAEVVLAMATQDIRDFDHRWVEGSSGAGHCQRRAPVGGMTSSDNRSSGLCVAWIMCVATCV